VLPSQFSKNIHRASSTLVLIVIVAPCLLTSFAPFRNVAHAQQHAPEVVQHDSASGAVITLDEFQRAFAKIKATGFVPSKRRGAGGVGNTFEQLLGLKENNIALPDLGFAELKAHRIGSPNRITLFTADRGAWKIEPLEAVRKFGIKDERGRLGLNSTLSLEPNSAGLFLRVEADTLSVRHTSGATLAAWNFKALTAQFAKKFPALVIVSALAERRDNVEWFHYTRAQLLIGTAPDIFREQLLKGHIIVDLRLTDQGTSARNHGTEFRTREDQLPLLFKSVKEIED
jgi:hypothetical protein